MFAAEQFRANLPQGREYYAIVGSDGYKKSCENKSTTCSTPEKMLKRVPMKKANFLYRNGCVLIKSRKKKCLRPPYLVKPRMPSLACEKLVCPSDPLEPRVSIISDKKRSKQEAKKMNSTASSHSNHASTECEFVIFLGGRPDRTATLADIMLVFITVMNVITCPLPLFRTLLSCLLSRQSRD